MEATAAHSLTHSFTRPLARSLAHSRIGGSRAPVLDRLAREALSGSCVGGADVSVCRPTSCGMSRTVFLSLMCFFVAS